MEAALTTATTILSNAWTFISGNDLLFGACCLGLLSGGIYVVKGLFH